MDYGCIFFGHVAVDAVAYLLLDVFDLGALCSTDDDGSYAGDRCRQRGRVKYGRYLSVLYPIRTQYG
jgi:hypothetical protein